MTTIPIPPDTHPRILSDVLGVLSDVPGTRPSSFRVASSEAKIKYFIISGIYNLNPQGSLKLTWATMMYYGPIQHTL